MANVKISELKEQASPSTSATLVGVDSGETVQIPMSAIQKGLDGLGDGVLSAENNSTFLIVDDEGNIALKVDESGLHATEVYVGEAGSQKAVSALLTEAQYTLPAASATELGGIKVSLTDTTLTISVI